MNEWMDGNGNMQKVTTYKAVILKLLGLLCSEALLLWVEPDISQGLSCAQKFFSFNFKPINNDKKFVT